MNIVKFFKKKLMKTQNTHGLSPQDSPIFCFYFKWKPNASQRRAFAERMQDSDEQSAYYSRQLAKKNKFYDSFYHPGSGVECIASKSAHDFCIFDRRGIDTPELEDAANQVVFSFSCNEKIDHYYIHIINSIIRQIR